MKICKGEFYLDDTNNWHTTLGLAIVVQAVKELDKYLEDLKVLNNPYLEKKLKKEIEDIIKFFHTDWYTQICEISYRKILDNCKIKFKDYLNETNKHVTFIKEMIQCCN